MLTNQIKIRHPVQRFRYEIENPHSPLVTISTLNNFLIKNQQNPKQPILLPAAKIIKRGKGTLKNYVDIFKPVYFYIEAWGLDNIFI